MGQGAQAIRKLHKAARLRRSGTIVGAAEAGVLEREGRRMLTPVDPLNISAGEVLPVMRPEDGYFTTYIKDTLQNPDILAGEASEARMKLAAETGVLELAVDAAESIQARNSLERMLSHQMAAAHNYGMRLLARAMENDNPPVEAARLVNAASRLLEIYQQGLLTLHRMRTGPQRIVVQHVQLNDSVQAVIAGNLNQGGDRGKDG